jgi:hypothetical protein
MTRKATVSLVFRMLATDGEIQFVDGWGREASCTFGPGRTVPSS